MNFWQIAAGSNGRDYSDSFLKFGMAFVGGEEQEETILKIEENDIVILKIGMSQIKAAGTVVSRNGKHNGYNDKTWLNDFDGWNLPAYIYVDWHCPMNVVQTTGLTRTTVEKSWQKHNNDIANRIIAENEIFPVVNEPDEVNPITDKQLIDNLIRNGLSVMKAQELNDSLYRIRLLAEYYTNSCTWEDIREHETRTFLVIPLLLSLGWTEQQIKIEYSCPAGRMDIALFTKPFHENSAKIKCIIETKDFSKGLDNVERQAKSYAEHFPECKIIVVTNGVRYKIYIKKNGEYQETPDSYLNILSPTDKFPLDPQKVKGAIEAIKWLLP